MDGSDPSWRICTRRHFAFLHKAPSLLVVLLPVTFSFKRKQQQHRPKIPQPNEWRSSRLLDHLPLPRRRWRASRSGAVPAPADSSAWSWLICPADHWPVLRCDVGRTSSQQYCAPLCRVAPLAGIKDH